MMEECCISRFTKWSVTGDFQQYGILTSLDSDEPVQLPVKLNNSEMKFAMALIRLCVCAG